VFSNTDLKKGTVYTEASKAGAKGLPFLKVIENGKTKRSLLFCREILWHHLHNCFVYKFET
jgi:hypothetical protein